LEERQSVSIANNSFFDGYFFTAYKTGNIYEKVAPSGALPNVIGWQRSAVRYRMNVADKSVAAGTAWVSITADKVVCSGTDLERKIYDHILMICKRVKTWKIGSHRCGVYFGR